MQHGLRRIVTVFMLAVALVLGWQRPAALACALDDAGCRDHCAIVGTSCAMACPAPIAPQPMGWFRPRGTPELVAFSFDLPVLDGQSVAPATAPPRATA